MRVAVSENDAETKDLLDKQIPIHAENKIKPNSFEAQSNKQFVVVVSVVIYCFIMAMHE